jgi:voltage-gated sodium channel
MITEFAADGRGDEPVMAEDSDGSVKQLHDPDKMCPLTSDAPQLMQTASGSRSIHHVPHGDALGQASRGNGKIIRKRSVKRQTPKAAHGKSYDMVRCETGRCETGGALAESVAESTQARNEQDAKALMDVFHEALQQQQQHIIQRFVQELQGTTAMLKHQHEESLNVLHAIGARNGRQLEHEPSSLGSNNDTGQPISAELHQAEEKHSEAVTILQAHPSKLTQLVIQDPPEEALTADRATAIPGDPPQGIHQCKSEGNKPRKEPKSGRMSVSVQKRLASRATLRKKESVEEGLGSGAEFEEWYEKYRQEDRKMNRGMFPDKNQMKKQLQETLIVKEYDVRDCYWESGCAQKIARSNFFEMLTICVIGLNAMWIAVDTDHNNADNLMEADLQFQIAENLFALYFFAELMLRFVAFECKKNCLYDFWFIFDSLLVIQVVMETWLMYLIWFISDGQLSFSAGPMTLLKIVRLCRTARIVRLLRMFPELLVLIRGIGIAIRSVFFTLVLLIVLTYVFSICLKIMTVGDPEINEQYFPTVWAGAKNMLLWAIVPDLEDKFDIISSAGFLSTIMFTAFIFIVSLTMLNMLIGVLVEVIGVVSSLEREQLEINHMKDGLAQLLLQADVECSGEVTIKEFVRLLSNNSAVQFLASVGIDAVALVDISEYMFKGSDTYEYSDMVGALLELRGSNTCTVKDIISLRKWLVHQLQDMNDCIMAQGRQLHSIHLTSSMSTIRPEGSRAFP